MKHCDSRQQVDRRTVVRGAAWAVPAVAVASAAPAFAASVCSTSSKEAIDAALAKAKPSNLEIYFYQPSKSLNGWLGNSYLNLRNTGAQDIVFTAAQPLGVQIDIVGITGDGSERDMSASTSFPTLRELDYVASTRTRTYMWEFVGVITPGREIDVSFHWRDGGSSGGRVTNVVNVTPLKTAVPTDLTLEAILPGPDREACSGYYAQARAASNAETTFTYRGPNGSGKLKLAQTVSSRTIGDYYLPREYPGDGIY